MKYLIFLLFVATPLTLYGQERFAICIFKGYDKNPHKEDIIFLKTLCKKNKMCPDGIECVSGIARISRSNINNVLFKVIDSNINCIANFNGTTHIMNDSCRFWGVSFKGADFSSVNFEKGADFLYSFFDNETQFYGSTFKENASFRYVSFLSKDVTQLGGINFTNDADFEGSNFTGDANFDGTLIKNKITFNSAKFNDLASFNNVKFGKYVSFKFATFEKLPTFNGSQLPDTLNLIDVNLNFKDSSTDFKEDNKIDFSATSVQDLQNRNNNKNLKCQLLIKADDIDRYLIPYDRISIVFDSTFTYEQKIRTYEVLISSCREAGMLESAEGWDIDYHKMQNTYRSSIFGPIINWFNSWWWNFGYEKWRILTIWLPFFFICFLTYNFIRIKALWNLMYKDPELGMNFRKVDEPVSIRFSTWRQRLSFAFFYTAVIYFGFKIRHESVNYNYTRGLLYLYFMYMIGTVHMAFAFSYILSAY